MRKLILVLSILSCNDKKNIKYVEFDMQNTIVAGAQVRLNKDVKVKRNSIVAFNFKNSDNIRILRVLGCPGDQIEINNGDFLVNNKIVQKVKTSKKIYTVYLKNPSFFKKLEKFSFSPYSANYSMFSLSTAEYDEIINMGIVDSIYTLRVDSNQVQEGIIKGKKFKYSNSFFLGPLKIPIINDEIDDNILSIIPEFLSKRELGNKIKEEYFFCVGDNFPEARDSRFIGLIPRSSIIGVVNKIENVTPVNVQN